MLNEYRYGHIGTDKDPTYEVLKDDPNKNWVTISFGLVTSDACLRKIDDKADRAF